MQRYRYPLMFYLAMIDSVEDQQKFEYLYHKYQKQMYYTAKQILNDEFLAEDAVHEAFCKIARNMDKVKDETSEETKSFVMVVTKRAAIDVYRKRKTYFDKEVYETTQEDGEPSNLIETCAPAVEIPELADFQGSALGKAIEGLSDDAKNVFLMRYGLDYSTREISEITGFTVSKIEKLLSRSKKKLAEQLSQAQRGDS